MFLREENLGKSAKKGGKPSARPDRLNNKVGGVEAPTSEKKLFLPPFAFFSLSPGPPFSTTILINPGRS